MLIGDVLLSTSYLQALKDNFPKAKIDFLVCASFDCVVKNQPCISDLIVSAKRDKSLRYYSGRIITILKIMRKRYDLVIDQQAGAGSG